MPLNSFDLFIAGVDRGQIEAHDVRDIIELLNKLGSESGKVQLKALRGRVSLVVNGYDDDPSELFEISDFSIWASELCANFNTFAYFFDAKNIALIMMAVLRAKVITPGLTKIDPAQQQGFLQLYLMQATKVGIKAGYSERDMREYFHTTGSGVFMD